MESRKDFKETIVEVIAKMAWLQKAKIKSWDLSIDLINNS